MTGGKRRPRRKIFAALAVASGLALIVLEIIRAPDTTAAERWFWWVVGLLLVGLGVAELRLPGDQDDANESR